MIATPTEARRSAAPAAAAAPVVLELADVHTYYGKIHALKGVSLSVNQGEIVTLIGSNGAGKSTTLRTISGLLRPKPGDVRLRGQSIVAVPSHKIVEAGVGHVPEGRGIFPALTVMENLDMGAFLLRDKAEFQRRLDTVFTNFPRLMERVAQKGGTLSGGEQQMLAIGRALMQQPDILRSTSRAWASRPCWWRKSLTSSAASTTSTARRSSWSSRTPRPRFRSPTAATSWKPARSA
jgi:ABC-type uncharacterized transport system ATPase subunit